MFCDQAVLRVKAGDGGSGAISFRHEKYVARGGPDGGDGGRGGNVYAIAHHNVHTLSDFRIQKLWRAPDGSAGDRKKMHGRDGEDIYLKLPVGTLIREEEDGPVIFDLTTDGQTVCLAHGGRGGYGNAHFTSSIRQAPRFAEKGETIEKKSYFLELKLVADIAIIGLPSSGKSTLISRISNARPKIADYPFTTLVPNLGIVNVDTTSFVVADIPGLIAGASEGKGLGIDFLRHVERCSFLLHLIDGTSENPLSDAKVIEQELAQYKSSVASKPKIFVINKIDAISEKTLKKITTAFKKYSGEIPFVISAVSGQDLSALLYHLKDWLEQVRGAPEIIDTEDVIFHEEGTRVVFQPHLDEKGDKWHADPENPLQIHGRRLEQIVNMTNMTNREAVYRLYDICEKRGILKFLRSHGWNEYMSFSIGNYEVQFWEE